MARAAFYFVSCLMLASMVACGKRKYLPANAVNKVGIQCQSRGEYVGACSGQNLIGAELGCLNLVCAKRVGVYLYEAVNTGRLNDGTPCGTQKVCSQGVCVQEAESTARGLWLHRAGFVADELFTCIIPPKPVIAPPPVIKVPWSRSNKRV